MEREERKRTDDEKEISPAHSRAVLVKGIQRLEEENREKCVHRRPEQQRGVALDRIKGPGECGLSVRRFFRQGSTPVEVRIFQN